jgi:hypothetical protein
MAEGVRVNINDATVISALNTPGGAVHEWRNDTEHDLLQWVFLTSPVNDPLNAEHRGGVVGTYKASWVTRRQGNGHRIGFQIENFADHAIYVEEGRRASWRWERFSWTAHDPPGSIDVHARGTSGRDGRHILRDGTNHVMAQATGGAYIPLV